MSDSAPTRAAHCPRCGVEMRDAAAELCPACVLAVRSEPAAALSGDAVTVLPETRLSAAAPGADARRFRPRPAT